MEKLVLYLGVFLLFLIAVTLTRLLSQVKHLTRAVYGIWDSPGSLVDIEKTVKRMQEKQINMNDKLRGIQNILSADRADRLGHSTSETDC